MIHIIIIKNEKKLKTKLTEMKNSQVSSSQNFLNSPNIFNSNNHLNSSENNRTINQETNSNFSHESSDEYTQLEDNFSIKVDKKFNQISNSTSVNIFFNFFTELFQKWSGQKVLYLTIQKIFIILSFILTLILFGLSLWVNIDERFVIIAKLTNSVFYSSFDLIMGFLPYVLLSISSISLIQDFINLISLKFIQSFLNSHKPNNILSLIKNQRALVNLKKDFKDDQEVETLKRRIKIRRSLNTVMINVKFLIAIQIILTLLVFIGGCFFNALYLHFNMKYIISYELPQTLIKIIRQYEKQQKSIIIQNNQAMLKFANMATNTLEENLINRINIEFACCNYQNPFQYGDMAPASCNFNQGCLKPMQNFLWDFIYGSVIFLLTVGSSKFLIQLVLSFNFYVIFYRRLIQKIYYVDLKKLIDNESDDEDDDLETKKRLESIRKQKEEKLSKEEEEEELRKIQEENELLRTFVLEKKQEEYEKMLLKQKRFKELRHEQMQRRIQTQHLLEIDEV